MSERDTVINAVKKPLFLYRIINSPNLLIFSHKAQLRTIQTIIWQSKTYRRT